MSVDPAQLAVEPLVATTRRRRGFDARSLVRRPGVTLSVLYLALVSVATVAPRVLTGYNPISDLDAAHTLSPPSLLHWFGTDPLGRDMYSRVVYGTRLSVVTSLVAVAISLLLGSTLGTVAGFRSGLVDSVIMRLMDVALVIPGLLLSLAVVSILGFGVVHVAIAVGIAGVPSFARLTRSETLRIVRMPYIDAARMSGIRSVGTIVRHVLPNAIGPVLVLAGIEVGGAVLSVSALSFLGFGAVPPTPEWGSMVSEGRNYMETAWWLTTFPGLAIAALVLATNRLSREFRVR